MIIKEKIKSFPLGQQKQSQPCCRSALQTYIQEQKKLSKPN